MKRKLIELGNGCLVVSLPAKYVRKTVLKKGDEIQLVEEGNDLRLSKGQPIAKSLSYSYGVGKNERIGRRVIAAGYRLGLAELELSYEDPKYFESVQNTLLEQTIGFEVVKQEERSCLVKDLSKPSFEEFDNAVQRCWFLLLDIAKDTVEGIKKKDFELLKAMHAKDRAVNKFTNYAMRLLLMGSNYSYLKTISYYHFLHSFEELADEYQDMATHVSEQKQLLAKEHILALEELNETLRSFFRVFSKFDDTEAEKVLNTVVAIQNKLHRETLHSKGSSVIAYYILSICRRIRNLMIAIVELNTCDVVGL
ncbi:hypothetical protein HYV85_05725 [Candidatus Woesearchaeota archaeon]|nr:hypothetical protein [Candidatus Woesearchaeota archaeon]